MEREKQKGDAAVSIISQKTLVSKTLIIIIIIIIIIISDLFISCGVFPMTNQPSRACRIR